MCSGVFRCVLSRCVQVFGCSQREIYIAASMEWPLPYTLGGWKALRINFRGVCPGGVPSQVCPGVPSSGGVPREVWPPGSLCGPCAGPIRSAAPLCDAYTSTCNRLWLALVRVKNEGQREPLRGLSQVCPGGCAQVVCPGGVPGAVAALRYAYSRFYGMSPPPLYLVSNTVIRCIWGGWKALRVHFREVCLSRCVQVCVQVCSQICI